MPYGIHDPIYKFLSIQPRLHRFINTSGEKIVLYFTALQTIFHFVYLMTVINGFQIANPSYYSNAKYIFAFISFLYITTGCLFIYGMYHRESIILLPMIYLKTLNMLLGILAVIIGVIINYKNLNFTWKETLIVVIFIESIVFYDVCLILLFNYYLVRSTGVYSKNIFDEDKKEPNVRFSNFTVVDESQGDQHLQEMDVLETKEKRHAPKTKDKKPSVNINTYKHLLNSKDFITLGHKQSDDRIKQIIVEAKPIDEKDVNSPILVNITSSQPDLIIPTTDRRHVSAQNLQKEVLQNKLYYEMSPNKPKTLTYKQSDGEIKELTMKINTKDKTGALLHSPELEVISSKTNLFPTHHDDTSKPKEKMKFAVSPGKSITLNCKQSNDKLKQIVIKSTKSDRMYESSHIPLEIISSKQDLIEPANDKLKKDRISSKLSDKENYFSTETKNKVQYQVNSGEPIVLKYIKPDGTVQQLVLEANSVDPGFIELEVKTSKEIQFLTTKDITEPLMLDTDKQLMLDNDKSPIQKSPGDSICKRKVKYLIPAGKYFTLGYKTSDDQIKRITIKTDPYAKVEADTSQISLEINSSKQDLIVPNTDQKNYKKSSKKLEVITKNKLMYEIASGEPRIIRFQQANGKIKQLILKARPNTKTDPNSPLLEIKVISSQRNLIPLIADDASHLIGDWLSEKGPRQKNTLKYFIPSKQPITIGYKQTDDNIKQVKIGAKFRKRGISNSSFISLDIFSTENDLIESNPVPSTEIEYLLQTDQALQEKDTTNKLKYQILAGESVLLNYKEQSGKIKQLVIKPIGQLRTDSNQSLCELEISSSQRDLIPQEEMILKVDEIPLRDGISQREMLLKRSTISLQTDEISRKGSTGQNSQKAMLQKASELSQKEMFVKANEFSLPLYSSSRTAVDKTSAPGSVQKQLLPISTNVMKSLKCLIPPEIQITLGCREPTGKVKQLTIKTSSGKATNYDSLILVELTSSQIDLIHPNQISQIMADSDQVIREQKKKSKEKVQWLLEENKKKKKLAESSKCKYFVPPGKTIFLYYKQANGKVKELQLKAESINETDSKSTKPIELEIMSSQLDLIPQDPILQAMITKSSDEQVRVSKAATSLFENYLTEGLKISSDVQKSIHASNTASKSQLLSINEDDRISAIRSVGAKSEDTLSKASVMFIQGPGKESKIEIVSLDQEIIPAGYPLVVTDVNTQLAGNLKMITSKTKSFSKQKRKIIDKDGVKYEIVTQENKIIQRKLFGPVDSDIKNISFISDNISISSEESVDSIDRQKKIERRKYYQFPGIDVLKKMILEKEESYHDKLNRIEKAQSEINRRINFGASTSKELPLEDIKNILLWQELERMKNSIINSQLYRRSNDARKSRTNAKESQSANRKNKVDESRDI